MQLAENNTSNSRLSGQGNFETECFLERVGCHQLFAGMHGFDHSFSYG